MKYRYSILTFVFGGYDRIRTPRIQDPEAEYVCITDHQVQVPGWKIVVDEKLKTKDPIYASYYIRYHAHEYVDSDIIVVVDASIQINDSLYPIIDMFHRTESQMSVMLTDFKNAEDKINYWICCLKRGSDHDLNAIREFLKETGTNELRGSTGAAFTIYRPVDPVVEYFEYCWKKCIELGEDGVPNRMDEVVSHVLLRDYQDQIKIFTLSIQIIQSTYMTYCAHLSDKPHREYKNYDQYYYLCGRPIYPYRFDKRGMFPNVYHCRTEAMLLTMRVMQVPQSQLDQLYIDELGMTAKEAQKMSPQAMAKRYANYRLNRNTPLTGWAYSEEERAKKIKSGEKRFNKLVKERTELHKNK